MPVTESSKEKIAALEQTKEQLRQGGGPERANKQHQEGKLTARERLKYLLDRESLQELGLFARHRATYFGMADKPLPADGVITGSGRIGGRTVHVASQDFTVAGGSAGEVHGSKIADAMRYALNTGSPFVFINDSGGARVQEGVGSLAGYARVFHSNVQLSGVVPQVSLICGPCAGGAAYSPALTDFIIQTRYAYMFITGPAVIRQVTGEDITSEQLGGPRAQMDRSGVVHFIADNDLDAIKLCKRLLSFFPSNNQEDPPRGDNDRRHLRDEALNRIVPEESKLPYDMREIITRIVDRGDFLEVQQEFAKNLLIGFARIAGRPIGIIANQPCVLAGALDINASDKGARFIRFCNAFNIPLVTLVDVPGFLPGIEQEYGGIIRHGAKLLFAYSAATVPKITVVVRKAYGGGYIAMCSKDLGADRVFAWPSAEIAVMGAEGAAEIVFRREISAADDQDLRRKELIQEYRDTFSSPYVAAGARLVDDIIEPADTRAYLVTALDALATKRELRPTKKHGNIPL
ncbi:MAG TPA: acyl-CoA carboxylase subunit beta [Candidatus Sulfopaludibacter sp.]|jgi:methylmalonyl-CoA carboxyltransferase large subunit|nr:acyl-CoA carboxylase subunit beta [Candidatus Sulfopaludibacter sp.]